MKKPENATKERLLSEIKSLNERIRELEKLIPQKIQAEETLRKEENFLLSIITSIQDGISILDKDLNIVLVNPTMEQWYADSMPLAGKKCYEAYHFTDAPCDVCPTRRTLDEGGAAHEVVPKRGKAGEIQGWLDLYSYPLLDAKTKKVMGAIEYVRDITTQTIAERKAIEGAVRLMTIIERVDEGITLSDHKGHFEVYNSKMGEITGYTMQEANDSKDFLALIYPDKDERRKALERLGEVVRKGGAYEVESVIQAKDGTEKTLLISTSYIRHNGEGMYLSVYHDISRRKEIDRLKDEFVGTVSHELRTPLAIVKEGISILLDQIPGTLNDQQAKVLLSAKTNLERLSRIINDLLDISKIESGKVEIRKTLFDICSLVRQIVALFDMKIKEKSLLLSIDVPEKGTIVYADEDMIAQVITNLVGNAVKFTEKGRVSIAVRSFKDRVECSVSDTGIGIAKENLTRIFGKFQQFGRATGPGEKGTGLGLSIAKKIIEMHKGRIWIESDAGKGTTVAFSVPAEH